MQVLLIHGMGRTACSMMRLRRWLLHSGHQATSLGYFAAVESGGRIVGRVRDSIEHLTTRGPYAVIGHSLGGLLARMALAYDGPQLPPPAHLIMLGTPNQLPRLAQRWRSRWLYRLINGESGQLLAQPHVFTSLPRPSSPYTIIAGTAGFHGRWSPFGAEPNDGLVAVAETRIAAEDQPITLPVRHTFMMNDPRVRSVIEQVLEHTEPGHKAGW